MKDNIVKGVFGTATGIGSAAMSFSSHVELWLRLSALALGVTVSALTALSIYRSLKTLRIRGDAAGLVLCDLCVKGQPPPHCPFPEAKDKPAWCPTKRG